MSTASPTAFLTWAVISCLFLCYLMYHLWNYDKFQCLRWNSGRQPGAFKRVMTYSYFLTIPLLVVFSVGITILKYKEGYLLIPDPVIVTSDQPGPPSPALTGHTIPKPVSFYTEAHQNMLLAIYFVFSAAWALEQVTHFEGARSSHGHVHLTTCPELAFWLFLLDQKQEKREWFHSWEYRMWYICCVCAIIGMPITTLVARNDLTTTDAWTFLVGSLSSTVTNVAFLWVLFRFPAFLRHVKEEGANPDVVVRLAKFYELNLIRVVFRFAAALPLLVLATDGIQGTHAINNNPFWVDFLLIITAVGQVVSSSITVMIFFPRSTAQDAGFRHKAPSTVSADTQQSAQSSYYPQEVTSPHTEYSAALSPKSIVYPPQPPHTPSAPSAIFVHRSTRRGSYYPSGMQSPATTVMLSASPSVERFADAEVDGPAPEYEMGDVVDVTDVKLRRSSKGVEFDLAEEDEDEDGRGEMPRLLRWDTVPKGTGSGLRHRSRSRGGVAKAENRASDSASGSILHHYVSNFTSPIDLADAPMKTIPSRQV